MWFGPIGHVASLHVSAVCRNFLIQEWDAVMDKQFVEVTGGKYPVQKDGYVSLPDGPGLGVDIDFEQLRKQLPWKS
jgi:L-alanine-DL-glutamate epimerase-like enolase superfamily enzyme